MSVRLGLVPLDDRPVCLDQVVRQAEVAGAEVVTPPREWLGHRSRPGDATALRGWLLDRRHDVDAWVLSLDMLVHGGLLASRTPQLDEARARACVAEVFASLSDVPEGTAYLFLTLRRLAPSTETAADLDAWREGHAGAVDVGARAPGRRLAQEAVARARASAAVHVLALLQEDARADPALAAEHAAVLAGAGTRVALTAGADEGGRALAARALGEAPPLAARFSGELAGRDRARARIAPYEDRALGESLAGQLAVAGLVEAPEAEVELFVWAPDRPGRDLWLDVVEETPGDLAEAEVFLAGVREALDAGRRVVVADVADANGADPGLWGRPEAAALLPRLHGFSAWNTAGNTLGCALAQLRLPRDPTGLARRVFEDWGYQSSVRAGARKWAEFERRADPWNLGDTDRARVESFATERLQRWWAGAFAPGAWAVRPGAVRLPWSRLFEATIDLEPTEGSAA